MVESLTLTFRGGDADDNRIDLYDLSISNYGLARSMAILAHYYQTGDVIAHAPKSDVTIYAYPYQGGSFRNTVAAGVVGGVLAAPFNIFITKTLNSWFPDPNPQMEQVIELLKEQNQLLREEGGLPRELTDEERRQEEEADQFIEEKDQELQVIRSITANSFKGIFRPVGRSVAAVAITAGEKQRPIAAIDPPTVALIESERRDEEMQTIVGVVNSFSRSSKTGVLFSAAIGRGFRFKEINDGKLDPQDDYSWSQYTRRPIEMDGFYVKWFDGRVKNFLVVQTRRVE